MNKNRKKIIQISSIVGILLILSVVGLFVANKGETEKVSSPNQTIKNKKVSESNQPSYEGINNLDYQVKRNEVVKLADGSYGVIFDIVSSAKISNEDFSALEQKFFDLAMKESGKDIKNVVVHVIDSSDHYESVKANEYKGNGLVTTITADHSKETPVVKATHYQSIQVPELKEREIGDNVDPFAEDDGNIDAFEYDVKDLVVEGDKMTLEVIATGKSEDIAKFLIGFIQVQRDLTPDVKTYALNIYQTSESLQAKSPKWKYDGQILTYEELLSIVK